MILNIPHLANTLWDVYENVAWTSIACSGVRGVKQGHTSLVIFKVKLACTIYFFQGCHISHLKWFTFFRGFSKYFFMLAFEIFWGIESGLVQFKGKRLTQTMQSIVFILFTQKKKTHISLYCSLVSSASLFTMFGLYLWKIRHVQTCPIPYQTGQSKF